MSVNLQSQIVLICRTEVEKTPKIVFPHEVDVLRALHGESRIELSDAKSPLGEQVVDLEAEFQRLLDEYAAAAVAGETHPVIAVYKDFDGFCAVVEGAPKPQRKARAA